MLRFAKNRGETILATKARAADEEPPLDETDVAEVAPPEPAPLTLREKLETIFVAVGTIAVIAFIAYMIATMNMLGS